MIKNPASLYTPGRRGLAWLKLKKAFATLDCVVVGAEFGHGKRHKVLSDYTFSVRDEATGTLKTIGKAYSGLTDAEIAGLTAHFFQTAIRQNGRYFEVAPDTASKSARRCLPWYTAGAWAGAWRRSTARTRAESSRRLNGLVT